MTTYQDPPLQSRRAARQGERAAAYGQQPEQAPEPLTYATQNRPPVPQYGGPDFRARRTPEAENGEPTPEQQRHVDQPATQLLPKQEVPSYRPRDFSPRSQRLGPITIRAPGRIQRSTPSRSRSGSETQPWVGLWVATWRKIPEPRPKTGRR